MSISDSCISNVLVSLIFKMSITIEVKVLAKSFSVIRSRMEVVIHGASDSSFCLYWCVPWAARQVNSVKSL